MKTLRLAVAVLSLCFSASAKDLHQRIVDFSSANEANPNCKAYYSVGIVKQSPTGPFILWGLSEPILKWLSKDGTKKFPSLCYAHAQNLDVELYITGQGVPKGYSSKRKPEFALIFTEGDVKFLHGSDTASVRSTTTGQSTSTVNGTITGDVNAHVNANVNTATTSTTTQKVQVPFERIFKPFSLYTYEGQTVLWSGSMAFTSQQGGNGFNSLGYNMGASIGNRRHLHQILEYGLQAAADRMGQ
jgi:hypothetical protein